MLVLKSGTPGLNDQKGTDLFSCSKRLLLAEKADLSSLLADHFRDPSRKQVSGRLQGLPLTIGQTLP